MSSKGQGRGWFAGSPGLVALVLGACAGAAVLPAQDVAAAAAQSPPATYDWHTFLGATGGEIGGLVAMDARGALFLAGGSKSWLGPAGELPLHAHSSDFYYDVVVAKLDRDGSYLWHTFYGSASTSNETYGIAVDRHGGVYVAGYAPSSWLGDGGVPPLNPHSGEGAFFVLKLASDGEYEWHTFYGPVGGMEEGCLAVDEAGNCYVVGESPSSWVGPSGESPLHPFSGPSRDWTVLALSSAGDYRWHTFYGSSSYAGSATAAAVAPDGTTVTVVGYSYGGWLGDGGAAPLHPFTNSSHSNLSVLELTEAGAYLWHTFYEGGDALGVAVDGAGSTYVVGASTASWLGDGGAPPLHAHTPPNADHTLLKLGPGGAYEWHTFYGSGTYDNSFGVATDGAAVYVVGDSYASWRGDGNTSPLHAFSGTMDIAVLALAADGGYLWHTFYGGTGSESAEEVVVTTGHDLVVAGLSGGTWNGDAGQSPLDPYAGSSDLFLLNLDDVLPGAVIFRDGFESGTTEAWISVQR